MDEELRALAGEVTCEYRDRMERLDLSGALDSVWRLIRRANKYADETAPWALAGREETRSTLGTVLYGLAETLRIATIVLTPFLVEGPAEFFRQLGLD